jgi:hypothetical protein
MKANIVKNLAYSVVGIFVGIVLGTALTLYFFGSMMYSLGTPAVTTADDETPIRRTLAECKLANTTTIILPAPILSKIAWKQKVSSMTFMALRNARLSPLAKLLCQNVTARSLPK